jgi:hypothetical protein
MKMCWPLLLVLAAACIRGNPLSPEELTALTQAEARWNARSFPDYSYEILQICFCPPVAGRWTRVTVRGGVVADAQPLEPDSLFPTGQLIFWMPIDSLFAQLRRAADDATVRETYRDIAVDFDPVLGYPTRTEWRARPNIQDADVVYSLRNVQPLP